MASRLTVLYGPSGVGKSSLLRAGVVQRLRALVPAAGVRGGSCRGRDRGRLARRPGRRRRGRSRSRRTTSRSPTRSPSARSKAAGRSTSSSTRWRSTSSTTAATAAPLAGELEEILTSGDIPVHVLLGIRDDALADLDAFKRRLPSLFGNVLRLDHLTRAAARAAIEGPLRAYAELGGAAVTAEDELVEAVLDEVAAGRIERRLSGRGLVDEGRRERRVEAPYLQLVLERFWEVERERGSSVLRPRRWPSSAAPSGSSRSTSSVRWRGWTTTSGTSSRGSSTTS